MEASEQKNRREIKKGCFKFSMEEMNSKIFRKLNLQTISIILSILLLHILSNVHIFSF